MLHISGDPIFEKLVDEAEKAHFSGWDFSFLKNRLVEKSPQWDYREIVIDYISRATAMLDMGTGGGEFLSALPALPEICQATEGWQPNLKIARQRLEPIGVQVHYFDNDKNLPFADNIFDLIINRHDSFDPEELIRILKPGGIFITQQVGAKDHQPLSHFLAPGSVSPYENWYLETAVDLLTSAAFEISFQKEEFPCSTFLDIGAVVYYLKVIEWQIPGFNTRDYHKQLLELHHHIRHQGEFKSFSHRFIVIAKKPEI
jgi:SAM-dependent methyltransferase